MAATVAQPVRWPQRVVWVRPVADGDGRNALARAGQLCGAASICLERSDLPPGNNCYDVCRGTEGALNASGHSDCPTGSYCQQFAVGLGVCLDR